MDLAMCHFDSLDKRRLGEIFHEAVRVLWVKIKLFHDLLSNEALTTCTVQTRLFKIQDSRFKVQDSTCTVQTQEDLSRRIQLEY